MRNKALVSIGGLAVLLTLAWVVSARLDGQAPSAGTTEQAPSGTAK